MRGRKEKPLESVQGSTTLIAKDAVITGDVVFAGNLDIEGKIIGSVIAEPGKEAMLRVVQGGQVEGEIRVPAAIINGLVEGDIHSSVRLELAQNAQVNGDVFYHLIEMAVGCRLNGGLRHVADPVDDLAQRREQRQQEGQ